MGTDANPASLTPEMAPILAGMLARMAERGSMTSVSAPEMRARARADFAVLNASPCPVAHVEDIDVRGAFGPAKARLYDPAPDAPPGPGLVYFHGGGWVIGDLDTEDGKLHRLANDSGVRVISMDYVLAPEHKFPAPLEDCIALAGCVRNNASLFGVDPDRLAIGGASAGANLALASTLALRDQGDAWARLLLLFYGVFDVGLESDSRRIFGQDFGLTAEAMDYFTACYLNTPAERTDWRASPLQANLSGLPPAFLSIAGADLLRDDSRLLLQKLRDAGVAVSSMEYPGVIHGFTLYTKELSAARQAIADAGRALRETL